MTASSSGGNTCLTAKGLDISLAALQRQDPYINNIVDVASQVALYTFNNRSNEWEKTDVEGTLFVYTRLASPRHGFTIMNRLSMENLTEPITKDLDFQLQDPFLLYRNARLAIYGIWFYDKADCQRIAELMKYLTKQEQALAQRGQQGQGGLVSPRALEAAGNPGKGQGVDILQMLTKARNEYDKGGQPEPKEIGGCRVLNANPSLIKPIPVKPMERYPHPGLQERPVQDSQGEPRPLSLATLFGVQQPRAELVSPMAASGSRGPGSQPQGKPGGVRPAVARSLSYDDPVQSQLQEGGLISGSSPPQHCPAFQKLMKDAASSSQPRNQLQRGGTMEQLQRGGTMEQLQRGGPMEQLQRGGPMEQLQRGGPMEQLQRGGPMEQLQPVSESSENRLHENGAPSVLHHRTQARQDPIQRLFQNQPTSTTPSMTTSAPCCPPPLQQPPPLIPGLQSAHPQPLLVDVLGFPGSQHHHVHLPPHQAQPFYFSPTKPPQMLVPMLPSHPSQSQPPHQPQPGHPQPQSQPCHPFHPFQHPQPLYLQPLPGHLQPGQLTGVVSPHELLQRLQLVQQEQSLVPEPTRPSSNLAPRFHEPAPLAPSAPPAMGQHGQQAAHSTARSLDSLADKTSAGTAAQKFQVISPQRIPATVAPTLLLSPSVFSQAKRPQAKASGVTHCPPGPHPPSALLAPDNPQPRGLSKSQLQATLLHLIQNDTSFLDTIYESYVHRFSTEATANQF
ncbi:mRNA-decapping enzyme 1B-like isoform X1 [Salvelinus namaycush]|uniref:5'-(N(7)-methylguanosine 5'-triphospho)-[mRNA] hydrolase n=2 Tax=Salvelinus namaycush TaxID=8040 RepID=A0A8U0QA53_SALNM|nr:mRNA-decapping enzyme 1B-like isoform X1 [Salvelinus namaycush]